MRFELDIAGDRQIARELLRVGEHAEDAAPAFRNIADYFRDLEREQFRSEGGSGSGGWPPLAASTLLRKAKLGQPQNILVASGDLRDSLTDAGDEQHIEDVSHDGLLFGTRDPKAKYHQHGTSRMPQRRPVELSETERRHTLRILQRWVMQGEV